MLCPNDKIIYYRKILKSNYKQNNHIISIFVLSYRSGKTRIFSYVFYFQDMFWVNYSFSAVYIFCNFKLPSCNVCIIQLLNYLNIIHMGQQSFQNVFHDPHFIVLGHLCDVHLVCICIGGCRVEWYDGYACIVMVINTSYTNVKSRTLVSLKWHPIDLVFHR